MWDTRAAAPLNLVHFGYGFGAIFANLLVRPFLKNKNLHVNTTISLSLNSTLSTSISAPLNSNIRVPYLITATLCFLIGIGHFIFLLREKNHKKVKIQEQKASDIFLETINDFSFPVYLI
jgi:fucose permease